MWVKVNFEMTQTVKLNYYLSAKWPPYTGCPKNWHTIFVRLNFTEC